MRIVFLCGSLEPGCDGVGDYTRRLALELIQHGYDARGISLKDSFVNEQYKGVQILDGLSFHILRIPANLPSESRFNILKEYINNFDPLWVSLQFVPYAYHSKGLPFALNRLLAKILIGRKLQVMFHELWVGMNIESSHKHKYLGYVQKYIIHDLLSILKPDIIHTQSKIYQYQLSRLGFKVLLLPLFSNIVYNASVDIKINPVAKDVRVKCITVILFGSIHSGGSVEDFAKELSDFLIKHNLKIEVLFIGRSGNEQLIWQKILNDQGIKVKSYGEQDSVVISELLANSTFGISTTPAMLADKSGTVAAMREHGLSVLCLSHKWTPRNLNFVPHIDGVFEYKIGTLEAFITKLERIPRKVNVKSVALSFCKSLNTIV